ncbi:cation diffusion facilitator family transporter [Methylomarinum sp. Ch1-1]|uniref:Cation diffusion facilitator family transporter n=1 Tax=Methylomarinum roseum TaxID=3067653 RepID=A0AAU7NWK0_9GAMM|nr:cation diffusion facilitator family transporter [Methylomarinum sp. Ch1-1]MDP4522554.1 cation diffusion facilitator family transporter [Methylomarinum sp. Ch1-1]
MSDCECSLEVTDKEQYKVLWWLLLINAMMFVVELAAGLLSESTALIADSLDMLADASVYAISLYAVGKSAGQKAGVAFTSGIIEIILGLAAGFEVVDKLLHGSEPQSFYMISVGSLALLANSVCVWLIARFRDGDVHMRASYIFSKNDVIANLGVVTSGLLVALLGSNIPDLLIGMLIALVVTRGGIQILKESREAFRDR